MAASTENLIAGFSRLPAKNKLGLALALAGLIALAAASLMWSRTPEYRVLFSNLSDRDGGAILAALGQMNVPYKHAEGGGAILVPAEMVHDARLKIAQQGLPKGSNVGFELMDNQKFGVTQFQEQINYQRSLEGELSRSIQAIGSVQGARVHLAIPKPSVFLRDQQKPTASVMVQLHPGRALDRAQIAGIVHMVASSVPELNTKSVSVLDQAGNLLSAQHAEGLDPAQISYVRELEAGYNKRIQDILEPIVGRGNVRAQVAAEIDFSQSEATAEIFKPNASPDAAAMRSQTVSEAGAAGAVPAQGVPGAASNQPGVQPPAPAAPGTAPVKKDSQVAYEVDRTVRHVRTPTGNVKRLSAAVVINHRKSTGADGKVSSKPLGKEEIEQIQALAREAMGFSKDRGDSLNVANAAFNEDREAVAEVPVWQQPENIALAKDAGKGLAGAALILYILFGILRPAMRRLSVQPEPVAGGAEALALADAGAAPRDPHASRDSQIENMRQVAQQDPRVVANVVRNWSSK
jgi:flagellar M-ring protein FliF